MRRQDNPLPHSQDSYEEGDPTLSNFEAVDQNFIDNDPKARALAAERDMAGLNAYLHTIGKRLPTANMEGYQYDVNKGEIIRTSTPWYEDPALLGAIGLPAAAFAIPALAGAGGAGGAAGTGAEFGITTQSAADAGLVGTTAPGSIAGAVGGAGAPSVSAGVGAGAGAAKPLSTIQKIGDLLNAGGNAIGGATNASANNRSQELEAALRAAGLNISGQSAFENELMNRSELEMAQRNNNRKDVARASFAANPRVSPFDPAGGPKFTDQYRSTLDTLASQGADVLSKSPQYATGALPGLRPYQPIDSTKLPGAQKGTLETVGDWLSPSLKTLSALSRLFG